MLVITVVNLDATEWQMLETTSIFERNTIVYPLGSNSYKLWSGLMRVHDTTAKGTDQQVNLVLSIILSESDEEMNLSGESY